MNSINLREPIFQRQLEQLCDNLRTGGWEVECLSMKSPFLIIFGKPGHDKMTVDGDTAEETLSAIARNLSQQGYIKKEWREMQIREENIQTFIKEILSKNED